MAEVNTKLRKMIRDGGRGKGCIGGGSGGWGLK